MSDYTQSGRQLQIKPLGESGLMLENFSGVEGLSEPFMFHLSLRSERRWIDPKDIVGKSVSFGVTMRWPRTSDPKTRWFHGIIHRFSHAGGSERLARYTAEVVPQTWLLTRKSDARIHQGKSTPEIVADTLKRGGIDTFEFSRLKSYPPREYCVQYRETDHDFISRLLEEEGIFYAYKRTDSEHRLVVADSESAYLQCKDGILHKHSTMGETHVGDDILGWSRHYDFRPGRWFQRDFNFEAPSAPIETKRKQNTDHDAFGRYEMFLYPGGYASRNDGDRITRVRMEAEDCEYETVIAETTCPNLFPGARFQVGSHPIEHERGTEWVVTRVEHLAHASGSFETGGAAAIDYSNRITCIPAKVVYRPPRRTPKPVMHGIQTAIVVGPQGEEIYVDKYGRVKVHFHWDRHRAEDENASCWIRVAHPWAGVGYGSLAIPRIGQEVVVEFEEGNPDRPLINGRVYNATQVVPVSDAGGVLSASAITEAAMNTTLRSNSLGKTGGYNEITMNDRTDQEVLYIKAQRDGITDVGHDQSTLIGNDLDEAVGNDHTAVVENNMSLSVGENRTTSVGSSESITIGGSKTEMITGSASEAVGLSKSVTTIANLKVAVGRNATVGTIGNMTVSVKKNETHTVEGARTTKVDKEDSLKVGKKLYVEAADEITLRSGSATVVLKKNGDILLKGKNIVLDASGKVDVKAGGNVKIKGSKIGQN